MAEQDDEREEKYEMGDTEELKRSNKILATSLLYADAFINKNYLINLDSYPVSEMIVEEMSDQTIRLFRIERIVYNSEENVNEKLISVYSALYNIMASGLLIIQSTSKELELYLGIRSEDRTSTAEAILKQSFLGNFPGSQIECMKQPEISTILRKINEKERFGNEQNVASVSIVPSSRDEAGDQYIQGLEKFIDTMQGKEFTAVIIADPIDKETLEERKRGLLNMYSGLSPFASTQLSYAVSMSTSLARGMSSNFSKSLNKSVADTNSHFRSSSRSRGSGSNYSFLGSGFSSSVSNGFSSGESWAHSVTEGTAETDSEGKSVTDTVTKGDTRTVTVTNQNKTVGYMMEKLDRHLKRIIGCEAYGLWDVASYFISKDIQTSVVAASTYKALMTGYESGIENSYVNIWNSTDGNSTPQVLDFLRYCKHPRFVIPGEKGTIDIDSQNVTPCSLISGNELPYVLGLPRHSVPGVTVIEMAEFGRNVRFSSGAPHGKQLELGRVFHMGQLEKTRVLLDLESFRSHCFITGTTGSGKSNTTYQILDEMIDHNIPFLVIEPAKGEYKRYYGALEGIHIYCTNPRFFSMLRLNPFRFNNSIHVLEHLDRLIEIFSACWPLYAAMPAILKESFERAYVDCGWDLENSIHIPNGRNKFPTFADVMKALPEIINSSSYSAESKGNYIGSLVTRVKSLTNGISGTIFCSMNDIDESDLFDSNSIVDLSRIASLETKSLLMGILILKLNEYRMSSGTENQPLRHVTVMEEAHNILKRTSIQGGTEGSNVQAKSVEMISASIAEMRTYGEGFIIVDQSPTALDASAVKNTNTKIVMRLPDKEDCEVAGASMGLSEKQMRELARFPKGVAAVYQNNWVEAVLTMVDKSEELYHQPDLMTENYQMAELRGKLVLEVINQYEDFDVACDSVQSALNECLKYVDDSGLNAYKKQDMRSFLVPWVARCIGAKVNQKTFCKGLLELSGCMGLFDALKLEITGDYSKLTKLELNNVTVADQKAVALWHHQFIDNINTYITIRNDDDDHLKKRVMRYLVLGKRYSNLRDIRYKVALVCLCRVRV